jgi:hypothetical protein
MPPYKWPVEIVPLVQQFETRHKDAEAGALVLNAVWTVDSLYYLKDLDSTHDLSQETIIGHRPDVVDVAHARWATGACITALDLCAAALGRVFCGHTGPRQLAIRHFDPNGRPNEKGNRDARRARLLSPATAWIDGICDDADYKTIKATRDFLTHARLRRHFTMPRQRLRLQVQDVLIDVPNVIERAKNVATRHVAALLGILPTL